MPRTTTVTDRTLVGLTAVLVAAESPSSDTLAVAEAQRVLARRGEALLGGAPTWEETAGAPAIAWHRGRADDPRRVLVLGHVDTVWPRGTVGSRPFATAGARATGPGTFDMKAGLAVGLLALARLPGSLPVTFLVTGDEEVGSPGSRDLVEREARRAQACVVLEGAADAGAVKSARKGWSRYELTCTGVAAHAGLEPDRGVNALIGLTEVIGRLATLDDPGRGVTVTPTVARAGTTLNTVPEHAEVSVDVRCPTAELQEQVDRGLRELTGPTRNGAEVSLGGGVNRPPMTVEHARPVLDRLREVAAAHGWPTPHAVAVGGISDANLTAAAGTPTLDGLGAVGGGAHAEHEWVDLDATSRRIDLVAALVGSLATAPLTTGPDEDPATTPPREEGTR